MSWYEAYAARTADDGSEGRLVSLHEFAESWDSWEMHPVGDELVVCLAGAITLLQEYSDGRFHSVALQPYEYAVNPADAVIWPMKSQIETPLRVLAFH